MKTSLAVPVEVPIEIKYQLHNLGDDLTTTWLLSLEIAIIQIINPCLHFTGFPTVYLKLFFPPYTNMIKAKEPVCI